MSRINTNINALNALRSLNDINSKLSVSQLRLATGKRINNAADDAAGFTIAKKFNARSQGLGQALANIGSAKNLMAVAEGHLNNILDILTQMKTKATQAADDSLGSAERNAIQSELKALATQIDLEVTQATWNSQSIFGTGNSATGSGAASSVQFKFQIGAGASSTNDVLKFDLLAKDNVSFDDSNTNYKADGLRVSVATAGRAVTSSASAQALMSNIDTAIADVSEGLSYIGAVVNRLTYQETSLTVARTNTEAARSRIEDADMAYEQLESTKFQILQQTASAMLAQANAGPQSIMQLFQ
ncbi:flagellin [Candidatus Kuenenia stuttgartiensis]|jgi:flagellin|uniref:Flagellin n=1 Tax=Kuenenia stuttgartiensis TaxID=174633 RepID=Q1Q1A7_KUEST|nr:MULTISPECIES: flagellin [Kuenenia]MBE7547696.1 flagellin [Planctomycetia bacterium]MBZ0192167.1 flagellin [Candidatus Kuenenia stuttgartiensis]MCL4728718.1 flagellin [Candidatus Kuenenia stuttgartiensis]MCZ7623675.1 flagellin [Candidatus Kuenenia sp.]QII10808.1 flagellin [Candidatus Kuenenia stuttgartiensis]